jgi:hypothetical protein
MPERQKVKNIANLKKLQKRSRVKPGSKKRFRKSWQEKSQAAFEARKEHQRSTPRKLMSSLSAAVRAVL